MESKTKNRPRICSVDKTLQIIGDRWTFLVLRECFFGVRHYDQLLENTGMATNILSSRLNRLVEHQILEFKKDAVDGRRKVYRLTERGLELYAVTVTLMHWGDRWLADENGPPLTLIHKKCGHPLTPVIRCAECGEIIRPKDMTYTENFSGTET